MKKKESLKELLERLDEQAAQFNAHLGEANRLFDAATKKVESMLAKEEKQLHATIRKVKSALKGLQGNKKRIQEAVKLNRNCKYATQKIHPQLPGCIAIINH